MHGQACHFPLWYSSKQSFDSIDVPLVNIHSHNDFFSRQRVAVVNPEYYFSMPLLELFLWCILKGLSSIWAHFKMFMSLCAPIFTSSEYLWYKMRAVNWCKDII